MVPQTTPPPHPCSHTPLYSTQRGVAESPVCQQACDLTAKPISIFSVTFTSLPDTAWGQSISSGVSRPTTLSPGFIRELEPYEFISAIAAAGLRNSIRHYLSQTTDLCSKGAALWCHKTKGNSQRYRRRCYNGSISRGSFPWQFFMSEQITAGKVTMLKAHMGSQQHCLPPSLF